MKLAIVGSTSLDGDAEAARIIDEVLDLYRPTVVVSGGAPGIDTMAVRMAQASGISTMEFFPQVRRWAGAGGFRERNLKIAEACDRLVRIVSAESTTYGSGWTRDRAAELGKPTEEFVVKPVRRRRWIRVTGRGGPSWL